MRVLQVSKYYYPEVGGIEQVVRTTAEGLSRDHEVRVLAAAAGGLGERSTVDGVDVRKATTLGEAWSVPLSPTFPLRLARQLIWADVVHVHLPNPTAVTAYHVATTLAGDDHHLLVTYHSDIVRQSAALAAYRPVLDRFLGHADRILTTSPRLLEHSTVLSDHADRCTVVPLAVDLDEYGIDADDAVATTPEESTTAAGDLPTDPETPTLLFVGRLSYYKGVDYLVDAMAHLEADADLLIVGDGEEREALEERVAARGAEDAVTFLGRVPDETVKRCYAVADLFVLPSVAPSEAFAVVQLEAMAYGTPVVNTDLPTGVPWVSQDGETGVTVPPENARALATAIDELLADPARRTRLGDRARERVESRFSRERRRERIAAVYDALTSGDFPTIQEADAGSAGGISVD